MQRKSTRRPGMILGLPAFLLVSSLFPAPAGDGEKPTNYPVKPIQLIVAAPAGGGSDICARALIAEMNLPQPIVVVNRPGASATIGTGEVARSRPDGYTLIYGQPASFYIQPHLSDVPYTIDSFRNMCVVTPEEQLVIAVTPDSPFKTFQDLETAMKRGDEVKFGTSNPGSVGHCGLSDLFHQMGVSKNYEMIPFMGITASFNALMGKHIDVSTCDLADLLPRMRNEQLRPLAIFGSTRSAAIPDTPSLAELGYPGTDYAMAFKWISAPKDTPEPIVAYLKAEINKAVMSDGYKKFIKEISGLDTYTMSEKEVTAKLKECLEKFGQILTITGMKKK